MLTYTISVSIRSTLLRYRPRRRPSVQLETDRPGIEATAGVIFCIPLALTDLACSWIKLACLLLLHFDLIN